MALRRGKAIFYSTCVPALIYALIILSAMVSITVAVYTSTRLVPRRPNYVICLIALVVAVMSFAAPKFIIARVLDSRLVGTMVVTALVFELIAITWIYGAKNIYTDLEFSIGRPIFKVWMFLWVTCPAVLTGILVWWCADDDQYDLLAEYLPRWAPILFVLAVILIIACIQIFRQVEYNFFGMICEASKPAKEGSTRVPRNTASRTAGRRRHRCTSPTGNPPPRATVLPTTAAPCFGCSAFEEDISVYKFPGITQQQYVPFQANDAKPMRYSQRMRQTAQPQTLTRLPPPTPAGGTTVEKHSEVVYIRRLSDGGTGSGHATRIEISPSNESITYGNGKTNNNSALAMSRNPLGRSTGCLVPSQPPPPPRVHIKRSASSVVNVNGKLPPPTSAAAGDHICWRKFNVNPEEYSTEL
ncbi:GL19298 [Drosophila persimilis]|uniref:GL19298 n=1 Tax=Drosophila persimilis TaxID=7234 RepID=B4IR93_DROPE|nr:GL19298 [Drosophila persimilis]